MFKCSTLSSPQINKRLFLFVCAKRKRRKKIQHVSEEGVLGNVIVSKLDWQTINCKFESH